MFKVLFELFRKESLLQQAYDASIEMLKSDQKMFDVAVKSLRRSDNGEMAVDIYAMDAKINEYQRDIRAKILTHLAVSQPTDPVFGLVLVSVVIDIERIGDYTKNIVELARMHPKKLLAGPFEGAIAETEGNVSERFKQVIIAFEGKDSKIALGVMQLHKNTTKKCDGILETLIKSELPQLTTSDAVAIALYTRYLKRISSHITNIASGIVNPFERIGFKESSSK